MYITFFYKKSVIDDLEGVRLSGLADGIGVI